MRTETEANLLREEIAALYEKHPGTAKAIALGGSHGAAASDGMSDLDVVIIVDEGDVMESAARIKERLRPILEQGRFLPNGPAWKEGFGVCFNYLYEDGFKVEIFVNNLNSIPGSDRVLRWAPLRGDKELEAIKRFTVSRLASQHQVRKAIFDFTYYHMSLCRHLSRKEIFAANVVVESLTGILLAIALMKLGKAYDTPGGLQEDSARWLWRAPVNGRDSGHHPGEARYPA